MVTFVTWQQAKQLVLREPVVFAEIVDRSDGEQSLEVHVMSPVGHNLHELERDDTGPVPGESVLELVSRIADERRVRYAAISGAEEQWPPSWA